MVAAIWAPEPWFYQKRVFVIGGGPTIDKNQINLLYYQYAKQTIVLNDQMKTFPWAGVLFFRDLDWFYENQLEILNFEGEVITTHPEPARLMHTIRRISTEHVKPFQPLMSKSIKYGRTSGHLSVSLAITMGAKEIVLIGFDGRSESNPGLYEFDFLKYWDGWEKFALEANVEIFNATSGSAIKEFPFRDLDELI